MTSGHQLRADLLLIAGVVGTGLCLRWIALSLFGG